jgi:hypothetical protein
VRPAAGLPGSPAWTRVSPLSSRGLMLTRTQFPPRPITNRTRRPSCATATAAGALRLPSLSSTFSVEPLQHQMTGGAKPRPEASRVKPPAPLPTTVARVIGPACVRTTTRRSAARRAPDAVTGARQPSAR